MKLVLLPCLLLHSAVGISMVPKASQPQAQPQPQPQAIQQTGSSARSRSITDSVSIRTTQTNDLPTIIELLSFETANASSSSPSLFNWNANLNRLKTKSSLSSQLTHRLAAVQAYSKCRSKIMKEEEKKMEKSQVQMKMKMQKMNDVPPRLLWNHDPFRQHVEKAVKTTLEYHPSQQETPWDEWNFALTPEKFMLFHIMMTAVDNDFQSMDDIDPEPVGFCEVIMVRHPNCCGDEEGGYIPCIMNLLVSPNQRRRGIGKRLMDCAIRSVRMYGRRRLVDDATGVDCERDRECNLNSVGLYVDEDNESAIALYRQIGFQVVETCHDVNERVFMELQLNGGRQEFISDGATNDMKGVTDNMVSASS